MSEEELREQIAQCLEYEADEFWVLHDVNVPDWISERIGSYEFGEILRDGLHMAAAIVREMSDRTTGAAS